MNNFINIIIATLFITMGLGGSIGDEDEMKERVFEIKIITVFNTVLTFLVLASHGIYFYKMKYRTQLHSLNSVSQA